MKVVYIVIYSNRFEEEWEVKAVFADAQKADDEAKELGKKHGSVDRHYHVEEWHIADTKV